MQVRRFLAAAALASASTLTFAVPVQWTVESGGNGHFYDFVAGDFTWQEAFDAAAGLTHQGLTGYLATVTSAEENTFIIGSVSTNLGWLGGSDAGAELNDWTWRTGPEAGQAFTYTNWGGGEPNNCCTGEDYLHMNWTSGGGWNDHGGPGNPNQRNGYFVEYSQLPAVPEPGTYALMLAGLGLLGAVARRRRTRG